MAACCKDCMICSMLSPDKWDRRPVAPGPVMSESTASAEAADWMVMVVCCLTSSFSFKVVDVLHQYRRSSSASEQSSSSIYSPRLKIALIFLSGHFLSSLICLTVSNSLCVPKLLDLLLWSTIWASMEPASPFFSTQSRRSCFCPARPDCQSLCMWGNCSAPWALSSMRRFNLMPSFL